MVDTDSQDAGAHYIYPVLGGNRDFGYFRVAGVGLGNCLLTYFQAYLLARRTGATLIFPAWPTLKIGPILRGERSKRLYIGLFRPTPGEASGVAKARALFTGRSGPWTEVATQGTAKARTNGRITVITNDRYVFAPLQGHREEVRAQLTRMAVSPIRMENGWGKGSYIAVHIRLGDFATASYEQLQSGNINNLRIPLDWYEEVLRRLRAEFPELPIHVFSDGSEEELSQILALEGVSIRREDDDLADMLALAGASILVASQSTYSRWAAYLGNMPTIWFRTAVDGERYSDPDVPVLKVGLDTSTIVRSDLVW